MLGLTGEAGAKVHAVMITDRHSTGRDEQRHLFGGMGVALCLEAAEAALAGKVCALDLQFIEPTPAGSRLMLEVVRSSGRSLLQASIEGRVDGRLVLTGFVSLRGQGQGASLPGPCAPVAPPPEACPQILAHSNAHEDIHGWFEMRLAKGRFGIFSKTPVSPDGHVLVWMRLAEGGVPQAAHLAMMADFLPSTTSNAFDDWAGGSSLNNSFRYFGSVGTEWILGDFAIRGVRNGVGHGSVELWGQDGVLAAIGGQSFVVRAMPSRG